MVALVAIISTEIDTEEGENYRNIKVCRLGDKDIQTPAQLTPYGIDSHPVEKVVGAMVESYIKGEPVFLGCLNPNQLAALGELRLYSTKADGSDDISQYIWLKNDETMEIGGNDDNMVSFFELKKAYNQLKSDHDATVTQLNKLRDDVNDLVSKFNTLRTAYMSHTHATAPTGPISTPTSAPSQAGVNSTANGQNSTGDIEPAKLVKIKTKKP